MPEPANGPERESGVMEWQEDVWRDIVVAALRGEPQPVPFATRDRLKIPAASRYSATTPIILGWFRRYNEDRSYAEQIRPFGFLTWFHSKRLEEHFWQEGTDTEAWDRRARAPKPVAPYERDISKAAGQARDRETWEPVPGSWLRTYAEALRLYHIHPETKFRGGGHTQSGPLKRRHVFATAAEYIGKEADRWEEDSHFGSDEDSSIAYGLAPADREQMIETIRHAVRVEKVGVKRLAKKAGVTDRTVTALANGGDEVSSEELAKLCRAAENLLAAKRAEDESVAELLEWARTQKASWLAEKLDYDLSNLLKVLSGEIRPKRLIKSMFNLRDCGG
jgi:transcriptional regulator with XRE-family HTH domain